MPLIKSAIKEVRKNKKRRLRNLLAMNKLKLAIKQVRHAKNASAAREALAKVQPMIDRAVSKKLIRHGTGSRYKSRLTKFVNSIK